MKVFYYIWAFIERFGANLISLGGNIALSYLLSPHDFGLVAMVAVFSSLITVLVDCGFIDALLMNENPSDRDFNTAFYFNVGMGVLLFFLFLAISGPLSRFFGHEELRGILIAMGGGAIFSGLNVAQMTKLRARLQFRRAATINLAAITTAVVVGLVMAACGMRYWALVQVQVGYAVYYFLLLVLFSKWNLRLEFDVVRFKQMWKFGVNLLLSYIVGVVSQNIFTFILGKFYNPVQAGYMGQGQKLQQTPINSVEGSISQTSYVLIAKKKTQDEQRDEIKRMFGVMTMTNSTVCAVLLCLSAPLIGCVFSEKWLPVIPYFRLMLVWGLVVPICNFLIVVFKLFDRTSVIRNVQCIEKTMLVIVALALYPFGINVMMGGVITLSFLTFMAYVFFAWKVSGIEIKTFLLTMLSNVLIAMSACGITFAVVRMISNDKVALIVGFFLFTTTIALLLRFFRRQYYDYVIEQIKSLRNKLTRVKPRTLS